MSNPTTSERQPVPENPNIRPRSFPGRAFYAPRCHRPISPSSGSVAERLLRKVDDFLLRLFRLGRPVE